MFLTYTNSDTDAVTLARNLAAHLNEFAERVISVSYSVSEGQHYVLAVYEEVTASDDGRMEAAVSLAEDIVEQAQA